MIPKFRCFDKDTKTMHEVVSIDFRDWRVYYEAYGLRNYWNKNVVLMQSTGLHDNTEFEDLSEEEQKEWLESGKTADEWQGREIFEGDLIHYTNEGDAVLDSCMGSGTTAIAAINTKRNFIGFELNKEYFEIAQNRIEERQNEINLFDVETLEVIE